jgi:hypothetical protein
MKYSISKIWTILKKDITDCWVLLVIIIIISLFCLYAPQISRNINLKVQVHVYGDYTNEDFFLPNAKVLRSNNLNNSLKKLTEGKIDAVIDTNAMEIYADTNNVNKLISIREGFKTRPVSDMQVEVVNKKSSVSNGYIHVLLALLMLMTGFIVGPIIYLSDKDSGAYSSLMLTPLTYVEYVCAKTVLCFICSLTSVLAFVLLSQMIISQIWIVILFSTIVSILFSLIAGIVSLPFNTMEKAMIASLSILFLSVLLETAAFLRDWTFLPIAEGYRQIFLGSIPWKSIGIVAILSIILLGVYIYLAGRLERR